MDLLTLFLIAFSLSFDSFAVSVCSGLSLCKKSLKFSQAIKIALSLAIFQGAMPYLGWLLGKSFKDLIMQADHWIAFILLLILGVKMIHEGTVPIKNKKVKNPTRWKVLLTMSLATSIDAFAVGISFSFFTVNILFAALLIGLVTLGISLSGIYMGRKLGQNLAGRAEILGGIILIGIGLKILIEHLFFA